MITYKFILTVLIAAVFFFVNSHAQQGEKRLSFSTHSLTSEFESWVDSVDVTKLMKESIDSSAIASLVEELKNSDCELRFHNGYLSIKVGKQSKAAIEALVRSLKDEDFIVRTIAAWALARILGLPKLAMTALTAALNDTSLYASESAKATLERFNSSATHALPALKKFWEETLNAFEEKHKNAQNRK